MAYPPLDQNDTSIVGPAEVVLKDPSVVDATANINGAKFDPKRPIQNWYIPGATDGIVTLKLATDPKLHSVDFASPRLVPSAIPLAWLLSPNVQDNPTLDKTLFGTLPPPLVNPSPDEHLVTLSSGAWNFLQVYVRKGPDPVVPAPPSGGDGVFSKDDRDYILASLTTLLNR